MGAEGGPSGPGPQALKDFCKISGPRLHPHPEAASLSGFKPVEWTEVTTQDLTHPPVSSCGSSVVEDEEDVPARVDSKSAFFFFFFSPWGSVWSRPGRQVQEWKALQQPLFVLGVRLLTGCVTSLFFLGRRGDEQANTPSIETPHLLYLQLNARLYGNLCGKETRAFGTAAETEAGVNLD